MQEQTQRWFDAIRDSHTRYATAVHKNLITSETITLDIEDGSVVIDTTSAIRRQLSLTLPAEQATWDALDTVGGEITVISTLKFIDGSTEDTPMGVFIVDQDSIGYRPDGTIQMTCPDRWLKVQRNNFAPTGRASVPSNMAWQEIERLVEGAWSGAYPFPGWANLDTTATTKVGSLLWDDGNREAAIVSLLTDNSLELFFDATGLAVLQPVPVLTDTSVPVWTVDASVNGVLISADRTRDRSSVRNVIIVSTSATDVTFAPQEVSDTTSGDPLATDGPLGYVPEEYSSATLRNSAQATAAGKTELAKRLGVAKQLSLESIVNSALDANDVILTVLSQTDPNLPPPTELHILDTVTTPLLPDGTQQLATRSTRPASDGT